MSSPLDILVVVSTITCSNTKCHCFGKPINALVYNPNNYEDVLQNFGNDTDDFCVHCNALSCVQEPHPCLIETVEQDTEVYFVIFKFNAIILDSLQRIVKNFRDGDAPSTEVVRPLCDDDLKIEDAVFFATQLLDTDKYRPLDKSNLVETNKVLVVCEYGLRFQSDVYDSTRTYKGNFSSSIFDLHDLFDLQSKLHIYGDKDCDDHNNSSIDEDYE